MKRFTGKTALVTGASSGIGLELAKLLAKDGASMILVSREPEKLNDAKNELEWSRGMPVVAIAKDLARPGAAGEIVRELELQNRRVDILINNAGVGVFGNFHETELRAQLELLQININSLVELTGLLVGGMIQNRSGWIMNVASMAAFQPGPLMACYYASKAFVLHFSEAIGSELAPHNVIVSAFCPGPVPTNFQQRAGLQNVGPLRNKVVMDAPTAARAGYEGLIRNQRVVIPGVKNKVLVSLVRFVPRRLVTKIVGWLQKAD